MEEWKNALVLPVLFGWLVVLVITIFISKTLFFVVLVLPALILINFFSHGALSEATIQLISTLFSISIGGIYAAFLMMRRQVQEMLAELLVAGQAKKQRA